MSRSATANGYHESYQSTHRPVSLPFILPSSWQKMSRENEPRAGIFPPVAKVVTDCRFVWPSRSTRSHQILIFIGFEAVLFTHDERHRISTCWVIGPVTHKRTQSHRKLNTWHIENSLFLKHWWTVSYHTKAVQRSRPRGEPNPVAKETIERRQMGS